MNTKDGKITDVLIEDSPTGFGFTVWADPDMEDIISSVPGVSWCANEQPTKYVVFLDPRYDVEWIEQEIIAQIKIADQNE